MNPGNDATDPSAAAGRRRAPPARRYRPEESEPSSSSSSSVGGIAAARLSRLDAAASAMVGPRGVSFNPETRVYLVPIHWEMPDEDRVRVWYSPRELEGLSKDVRKTVKYMRRRLRAEAATTGSRTATAADEQDEEDEGACDRGLEHLRSSAHMEQRRINRDCAQKAVFDEQTRQRQAEDDAMDVEELRRASEFGSAWSRRTAIETARDDEKAARRIQLEVASSSVVGGGRRRGRRPSAPARTTATSSRGEAAATSPSSEEILQQAMELCTATDCTHVECRRRSSRSSSSRSLNSRSRRRSKSTSPLRSLQLAHPNTNAAASSSSAAPFAPQRRSLSERILRSTSLDIAPLPSKGGPPRESSSPKTINSAGRGLLAMINGRQGLSGANGKR